MATYNALTDRDDASPLFPEDVSAEILGAVAEGSSVLSMAKKLPTLSGAQRRIRVWDQLPMAYFVNGDTGLKQTTRVKWRNVFLDVEEVATIVPIPENVLADADTPIFERSKPYIVEAIGALIDRAILFGENAPSNWPDSVVDQASAAGHVVVDGEVGDLYDDLLNEGGVLNLVEVDGFAPSGHLAQMGMKARLRGLRDQDDRPIFLSDMKEKGVYALDGERLVFPRNGALLPEDDVRMISGAWDELVWAPRQDITYKVLDQAVINDADGNIIFNLAQQDMVALRVVMRMGWALPNPTNRLNSDDETRFPFAILAKSGGTTS